MGHNMIEKYDDIYVLRLDNRVTHGLYGDKARIAYYMSKGQNGIVTCGSRESIQTVAFAQACDKLNIPCCVHIPKGKETTSTEILQTTSCEIIREKVGYNNVLNAHARDNAASKGYKFVKLGMLCDEAYDLIGENINVILPYLSDIQRIVIPVGSGTTLIGICNALEKYNIDIPVLGVMSGMDATKNIASNTTYKYYDLVMSTEKYHKNKLVTFYGIDINPVYESKCIPYLKANDLFYIVAR